MYYLTFLLSHVFTYHLLIIFNSDLNRLIMDYLVIEGYKSAAEEFSQEANLAPPVDFESIESRMDIREALQRGDIEDAITRVNDLNPEVCGEFSHVAGKV
jgi:glucose-induced degradation protein 8